MKNCTWITSTLLATQLLNAQQPPLTGDWRIEQQRVRLSGDESSRSFLKGFSEGLDIEIFPDHRFSAGPNIGRWIFSNDYLLAIQEANIDRLTLNMSGDSFAFATSNSTGSPSNFVRESGLSIAVKRPTTDLTSTQMAGDWVLLRQSIEYSELDDDGSIIPTLLEVNQVRTEINLAANGTLLGETVIDTESPGNEGSTLSGTWAMPGGTLSATVGGEVTARPNISSGADLIIHSQEDSLADGDETQFGSTMEAWVKSPNSLTISDVVGSWGLAGIITEVLPVPGSTEIALRDFEIQEARVHLREDGTGMISNLDREGIPLSAPDQDFTWTLEAGEIVVSARDETFRFTMTAGKDFAVLLQSSLDDDSDALAFNFFALSKLPKIPGFAADAANGSLSKTPGANPEVTLAIQSVVGIPYQVQESVNLVEWLTPSAPTLGTGGEISSTFEATSMEDRFYRWKLLPLGEAP